MTVIIMNSHLMCNKATLEGALNKGDCEIHEPSIMGSWTKRAGDLPVGFSAVCTRMLPQRDKFIAIERRADGWKVK